MAIVAAPGGAAAADLAVEPAQTVVKHRKRVRALPAVRDYDGTPVVLRPYRPVPAYGPDGAAVVRIEYEAVPVIATPLRYMNGEPVLPHHPRGWPREATLRHRTMLGRP